MSIFNYKSYKEYLNQSLKPTGPSRGLRAKLANYLNCQTGYVSQVLKGFNHFSIEHCYKICQFLSLSKEEERFFMILAQKDRAGTTDLEHYYEDQLKDILVDREKIKNRIGEHKEVSEKDYNIYFGNWYYPAVHVLASIPGYQNKKSMSEKLGLPIVLISEILNFLVIKGLVIEVNETYKTGSVRIHLPDDSSMVTKHHSNWRIEAIKALSRKTDNDLHFSGIIALSKKDIKKIKEILLKTLEDVDSVLGPSKEEDIACLNIDLFNY
jgi:uncharacterized protein (TIGR02147 family)